MQEDINDIINSIKNLTVKDTEMATKTVDMPLLRYQADNIPLFDGSAKQLNRFINSCEHFLKNFQNKENLKDPINVCLLDTIFNKLTGRAADLICSRSELTTWEKIKDALILSFSDQRGVDCLIQELINLKPYKGESPIQFGIRIQDARSLLFSKLNSNIENAQEKLIKVNHYDDFALKTFIHGLPYNLQLVVRLRDPTSLEEAMSLVTEEENFKSFNATHNFNQTTYRAPPKTNQYFSRPPFQKQPLFNTNQAQYNQFRLNPLVPTFPGLSNQLVSPFRPNYVTAPMTSQTPSSQFRQNYMTTPMASQIRPVFNSRPFPNYVGQNWGKFPQQQHPFAPNQRTSSITRRQNQTQQNYKPEPMDTSSGNTMISPKPNFTSQELFNQQVNDELTDPQYLTDDICFQNSNYNFYNPEQLNFEQNALPDFEQLLPDQYDTEQFQQVYDQSQQDLSQQNFQEDIAKADQT